MYVLILFAIIVGPDGKPLPITRPDIEYYQTEDDCKKFAGKHIKEFFGSFETEPVLSAGKCIRVSHIEGEPA